MLIFDAFESNTQAKKFVADVKNKFKLDAHFCKNQEEVDTYDFFPFLLKPPMAVVERTSYEDEDVLIKMVKKYAGEFAGT